VLGTAARASLIRWLPGAGTQLIDKSTGKLHRNLLLTVTDENCDSQQWGYMLVEAGRGKSQNHRMIGIRRDVI